MAVIARTAALATMPRASRTSNYRKQEERVELFACFRGLCHTEPTAVAGNLDDPSQGMSLRHLSRKPIPRPSTLSGSGDKTSPLVSDMPGSATSQGTTRPGRRHTMATGTGSTPCQADGLEKFSGKFRRCWKLLHRFSGSNKCYPCQGLGIFRQ